MNHTFSLNHSTSLKLLFNLLLIQSFNCFGTVDTWIQKADLPGIPRINAVSFVVNGQAFIGTGEDAQGNLLNDFWKFDPSVNAWSQVADFGGVPRKGSVGFAIDSLGYVGTGYDGTDFLKDFWQFSVSTNSWQQIQDLGQFGDPSSSSGRRDAVAVVANSKCYLICGYDGSSGYIKQTWQFDPSKDTSWALRRNLANVTDFTLYGRRWAVGFGIQDMVYFGTGFSFSQDLKQDFWKYNPLLDAWTQVADFGGSFRSNAVAFSMYNKGYVGCGTSAFYENDFWRYDPFDNNWTQVADYGGIPMCNGVSFVINNRGYAGLGNDSIYSMKTDMWEYTPDSTTGIEDNIYSEKVSVFPNPVNEMLNVELKSFKKNNPILFSLYNSTGQMILQEKITGEKTQLNLSSIPKGIFFYSLENGKQKITCGKILLN
ncbi:MAG: kelch repeat-containing protein [Bacteroidia bacterium]